MTPDKKRPNHSRLLRFRGCLLALVISALTCAPAVAQPQHTLNLQEADIQVLISTVADITGRNFIVDPRVTGKVTVISSEPMNADQIYDVFQSILRVHGFAAVPSGATVRIVPDASAKADAPRMPSGGVVSPEELITRVVQLEHVTANELVPILRPLMPQEGHLAAHTTSNLLIVSDRAGNVDRLMQIIRRIDTAADEDIEVIPLQHANAAELVRTLALLDQGGTSSGAPRAIADERTNTVLLTGERSKRIRTRALISHLDTPLESGGATNVIYLNYASAETMVPILQDVAQSMGSGGEGEETFGIQAHPDTNSLIVSAPPAVFRAMQSVVRQLDIRRAQVLIEAVVAEISVDTLDELGVQWQAADNFADGRGVIGGTNFGNTNNILGIAAGGAQGLANVGQGLNIGYLEGIIEVGGTEILNLGALVSALNNDSNTNLLATPSAMTLDHQEAQIQVGQEVPFVTGQFTNTGANDGATNPFTTVERKDVGLTLRVTPHVNEGDSVVLDVNLEVSSLAPNVTGAVDLITNKRTLTSTVIVQDSSILVLGGLLNEQIDENLQKVPALGDIPVLGNLFRYRSTKTTKRNLMIFLHPRILRNHNAEYQVTSGRYDFIRAQQMRSQEERTNEFSRQEMPLLPEISDYLEAPVMERPDSG